MTFLLHRRALLMSTAALSACALSRAATAKTLKDIRKIDPTSAPWARWWWPGGVVSADELRREIQEMKAAGFAGAEIQVFNPGIPNLTSEERSRIHDFANAAFFEHMQVVAQQAAESDFGIDYTFGSAWPSGGGFAITPELALVELTPALTSVTAPVSGPIQVNLPKLTKKFGNMGFGAWTKDPRADRWKERIAQRQKIVAIIAIKGEAPVLENGAAYRGSSVVRSSAIAPEAGIVITDRLRDDGTVDWTPPQDGVWQIVAFSQFAVDSSVMAGVGEGPQLVLDHFYKPAFEAHAARVGDPLAKALKGRPSGVRAMFVDSLELMQDIHWTEHFLDAFKARRGYDLTPYLPLILQPGWMEAWGQRYSLPYFDAGALGERIRFDYRHTVSELFLENFWSPFAEWSRANGFKAKGQAHGGPCDTLKAYGMVDIPETEDLESGGDTHFMRLARAAARIYGKPLVSAESFVWKGEPYDVSPARLYNRANLLFASGVTQIVAHGYPYSSHPEKWPGWHPFAPSPFLSGFSGMFNAANPIWPGVQAVNAYISTVQHLLQSAKPVVPVAIYLGDFGYYHGMETQGRHEDTSAEVCLKAGYDYDRINADALLKSRIVRGRIVTPGGADYEALVFPSSDALPAPVAEQLVRFVKSGGKVIFTGEVPGRHTGLTDAQRLDSQVRSAIADALSGGAVQVALSDLPDALARKGVRRNITFTNGHCVFVEYRHGSRSYYLLHNPETTAQSLSFRLSASGTARLWDILGQSASPLPSREGLITADLAPDATVFIAVNDRTLKAESLISAEAITLADDNWRASFDGHGQTVRQNAKQEARVISLPAAPVVLGDYAALEGLKDFSGRAVYETTFELPADWARRRLRLKLSPGRFHDVAEVRINAQAAGTAILPDQVLDITAFVTAGLNRLEIQIFNTPNNAMIDPSAQGFKDLTAKPAGLYGPVSLFFKR